MKGQSDNEIAGTPRNIFKYDSLVYINAGTALITIKVKLVNWGIVKILSLVVNLGITLIYIEISDYS